MFKTQLCYETTFFRSVGKQQMKAKISLKKQRIDENKQSAVSCLKKVPKTSSVLFLFDAHEVKANYSSGFFKRREVTDLILNNKYSNF